MDLSKRYLKCFNKEQSEQLKKIGYKFLYSQSGVFYFEDNKNLTNKFSKNDVLKGVKKSITINF